MRPMSKLVDDIRRHYPSVGAYFSAGYEPETDAVILADCNGFLLTRSDWHELKTAIDRWFVHGPSEDELLAHNCQKDREMFTDASYQSVVALPGCGPLFGLGWLGNGGQGIHYKIWRGN